MAELVVMATMLIYEEEIMKDMTEAILLAIAVPVTQEIISQDEGVTKI